MSRRRQNRPSLDEHTGTPPLRGTPGRVPAVTQRYGTIARKADPGATASAESAAPAGDADPAVAQAAAQTAAEIASWLSSCPPPRQPLLEQVVMAMGGQADMVGDTLLAMSPAAREALVLEDPAGFAGRFATHLSADAVAQVFAGAAPAMQEALGQALPMPLLIEASALLPQTGAADTAAADGASGDAGDAAAMLGARALARAQRLNPRWSARLAYGPQAFSDAAPGSVEFAEAVAAFQSSHGLTVDGIAGPNTWAARRAELAAAAEDLEGGDARAATPGADGPAHDPAAMLEGGPSTAPAGSSVHQPMGAGHDPAAMLEGGPSTAPAGSSAHQLMGPSFDPAADLEGGPGGRASASSTSSLDPAAILEKHDGPASDTDPREREADAFAAAFIARKADGRDVQPSAMHAVDQAQSSAGAPLPGDLKTRLEATAGQPLDAVRVHTGAASAQAAEQLGAQAYAIGQDVHFAAGKYDPTSTEGQKLIAHEVAHTLQSTSSTVSAKAESGVVPEHAPSEHAADAFADAFASAGSAPALGASAGGISLRRTSNEPSQRAQERLIRTILRRAAQAAQTGVEATTAAGAGAQQAEAIRRACRAVATELNHALESATGIPRWENNLPAADLAFGHAMSLVQLASQNGLRAEPDVSELHHALNELRTVLAENGWSSPATVAAAQGRSDRAAEAGTSTDVTTGDNTQATRVSIQLGTQALASGLGQDGNAIRLACVGALPHLQHANHALSQVPDGARNAARGPVRALLQTWTALDEAALAARVADHATLNELYDALSALCASTGVAAPPRAQMSERDFDQLITNAYSKAHRAYFRGGRLLYDGATAYHEAYESHVAALTAAKKREELVETLIEDVFLTVLAGGVGGAVAGVLKAKTAKFGDTGAIADGFKDLAKFTIKGPGVAPVNARAFNQYPIDPFEWKNIALSELSAEAEVVNALIYQWDNAAHDGLVPRNFDPEARIVAFLGGNGSPTEEEVDIGELRRQFELGFWKAWLRAYAHTLEEGPSSYRRGVYWPQYRVRDNTNAVIVRELDRLGVNGEEWIEKYGRFSKERINEELANNRPLPTW